jgi:DUF2971 family protein
MALSSSFRILLMLRLFKYLHPARTDVLLKASIRFSSPLILNDPFELKPHISAFSTPKWVSKTIDTLLLKEVPRSYEALPVGFRAHVSLPEYQRLAREAIGPQLHEAWDSLTPDLVSEARRRLFNALEEQLGILCLTEAPTSLLMWAHYADSHRGLVVEFVPDSPFFNQRVGPDDELRHLRKVTYRQERPAVVLTELDDFSVFLMKSSDWSYEAEWRMMLPLSSASQIIGDGPKAVHLFEFPKAVVRRVIFGCRISDFTKSQILWILQESPEYQNVQCQQARIDETHYRLILA